MVVSREKTQHLTIGKKQARNQEICVCLPLVVKRYKRKPVENVLLNDLVLFRVCPLPAVPLARLNGRCVIHTRQPSTTERFAIVEGVITNIFFKWLAIVGWLLIILGLSGR